MFHSKMDFNAAMSCSVVVCALYLMQVRYKSADTINIISFLRNQDT